MRREDEGLSAAPQPTDLSSGALGPWRNTTWKCKAAQALPRGPEHP